MLRASVVALGVLLAPGLMAQGRDEGVREGEHFRVVPHFAGGGELAQAALAAAEASWGHSCAAYGLDPSVTAPTRLRVHLYRERAEFDDACLRCEGRTWPANSGLTSGRWGIALVLVGRDMDDGALKALGLTDSDLELVAHESAHLVGHHLVQRYAGYPPWLSEGLAEWVASRSFEGQARPRPSVESRVAWLQGLRARGGLPSVGALLGSELEQLDPYVRYALYGRFFEHLFRRERAALRALQGAVEAEGDLDVARGLLAKGLGSGGLDGLETRFLEELSAAQPAWAIGEGSFDRDGERWRISASELGAANAWRYGSSEEQVQLAGVLELGNGALALNIGRSLEWSGPNWEEHFVAIVLAQGRVTVERRTRRGGQDGAGEQREQLATADAAILFGQPVEVAVRAGAAGLQVSVNGERLLTSSVVVQPGQWGLAAKPGAWGWWAELRASGRRVR